MIKTKKDNNNVNNKINSLLVQKNEYDGVLDAFIALLVTCFKLHVREIRLVKEERGRKMKKNRITRKNYTTGWLPIRLRVINCLKDHCLFLSD